MYHKISVCARVYNLIKSVFHLAMCSLDFTILSLYSLQNFHSYNIQIHVLFVHLFLFFYAISSIKCVEPTRKVYNDQYNQIG